MFFALGLTCFRRIILSGLCLLGSGWIFAQPAQDADTQSKYVAIFVTNSSVSGKSFPKGMQLPIQDLHGEFDAAVVEVEGKIYQIPKNLIRIVPADKAGISIIRADYGVPGQPSQNVTEAIQKLVIGQTRVSLIVSDAVWNQYRPGGGNRVNSTTGATQARVLMILYSYKGESRTAMAAEGQPITLP